MATSMTLGFTSAVAMVVQLLIFVYLYRSHRSRFFRYFIGAWACFVVRRLADPESATEVILLTAYAGWESAKDADRSGDRRTTAKR